MASSYYSSAHGGDEVAAAIVDEFDLLDFLALYGN